MDVRLKAGFALTGSFCTFDNVIPIMKQLVENGYDITPIFSEFAYETDTRFGKAADFAESLKQITGNTVIHTITQAEPIGPYDLFDVLVIAPCTGNTLGKLNCGITDTSVTMAAKAHLRNEKPLLIAVSTNDALGASSKNIGGLLTCRNVYFVPMKQDSPDSKPRSVVADFSKIPEAIALALQGKQLQPVYL
ncbi:MAG: dipicolinate synthase subunit B [Oscillospiraceae bacterium]|nr:dipicolinate synthase subunit B [Oscillospiraceae bacterium]